MTSQYQSHPSSYPRPTRTPSPNLVNTSGSGGAPRLPPKDTTNTRSVLSSTNNSASASRSGSASASPHNNNNNKTKDYLSLPPSTSSFSNNLSRYATATASDPDDLARAVRDSVQIRSPSPSSLNAPVPHPQTQSTMSGMTRRSPSPRMMPSANFAARAGGTGPKGQPDFSMGPPVGEGNGWEPGHGYSHSSPDMGHISQSTMMPRQVQTQAVNPFEEDEMEPPITQTRPSKQHRSPEAAGLVAPSRQKFSRATSGTTPSSVSQTPLLATSPDAPAPMPKTRVRRSLSTDSYGLDTGPMRELTAGQKKAAAEKKGSKHADIIDRWDPTGLGDARPYDAAAPSRNVGNTKAPMQVFSNSTTPASGAGTSTTTTTAAPGRKTGTIQEDEAARASVPASAAAPIPAASARQPINRRVSGGGLTGQYSTSIPSGGGYFPDAKQPQDEVSIARMEREREKEQKQRALKAAWGIDEPEPWEDFGVSPNETTGQLGNEGLAADTGYVKPVRSPGLRLGNNRADSFTKDQSGLPSPTGETPPIVTSDQSGRPGVKRTKSLMQKFKTMVRTRSGSVASTEEQMPVPAVTAGGRYRDRSTTGVRSQSMSTNLGSGAWGGSPERGRGPGTYEGGVMEEEEVVDEDGDRFRDADEDDGYGDRQLDRGMREGRENKSVPFRSASPSKAVLPSSPSYEFPLTSPNERDEHDASASNNPFLTPNKTQSRTVNLVGGPTGTGDQFDDAVEMMDGLEVAGGDKPPLYRSETEKEFVFVDSPQKPRNQAGGGKKGSTAPTESGVPPVPALPASVSQRGLSGGAGGGGGGRSGGNGANGGGGSGDKFRPLDRVKHLPPPPVGQVMPDFADIDAYRRRGSVPDGGNGPTGELGNGNTAGTGNGSLQVDQGGSGMRRKTSVVKKIKERIK